MTPSLEPPDTKYRGACQRFVHKAYHESGLQSLHATGLDAVLIISARTCRMLANGAAVLILALFFDELHTSESRIGLFMSLTLAGDVILSLLLTLVADRIGRRRTLFFGAVLMLCSGTVFALFENYWLLLTAAVVGVISATGGDLGPFRTVEESMLSELTTPETRADVLAWYTAMSSLGAAVGTDVAGRAIEWVRSERGWTLLEAYHACFWAYAFMGGLNMVSAVLLSKRSELQALPEKTNFSEAADEEEQGAFLANDERNADPAGVPQSPVNPQHSETESTPQKHSKFSSISRETRSVMYALWFLLMVDSLADGMTPMSLTTFYVEQKFDLLKSTLGDFLSASYFLSAIGSVFAGPLSRHIGLVNTMVFTHIPSSTAVLLFPLPSNVIITFVLLLIRVGLNNMDQAPRSALIAAVVKPEERTAVMGITNMLRTLASTTGPTITGFLAGSKQFWIAFVAAGVLRLAYDVGLWVMFVNISLYKHEKVVEESGSEDTVEMVERRSIAGTLARRDEEA
jgi:MFS family permease